MKNIYFAFLIFLTTSLLLCSCAGELTVEQTAERFLNAIKTGDKVSAKKYVVESNKARLDEWTSSPLVEQSPVEIISSELKGNEASVTYKDEGIEKVLRLIKENGKWKCIFDLPGLPPYNPQPKDSSETV